MNKNRLLKINIEKKARSVFGEYFVNQALNSSPQLFFIKKSNGKYRKVLAPKRKVLIIQKYIYSICKEGFDSSEISFAYETDKNIIDNAKEHIGAKYVLKTDISNFFNSITKSQVQEIFSKLFNAESAEFIASISTHRNYLYIGSVLAPLVSNQLLKELDCKIVNEFPELTITRYADDYTFSSKDNFNHDKVISFLRKGLLNLGLNINDRKTQKLNKVNQFFVTGISVHKDKVSISRRK